MRRKTTTNHERAKRCERAAIALQCVGAVVLAVSIPVSFATFYHFAALLPGAAGLFTLSGPMLAHVLVAGGALRFADHFDTLALRHRIGKRTATLPPQCQVR